MHDGRPLVIAHRGASVAAIDNSLESFEQAIADGADMIEFDLRRTADAQLIAFHDPSIAGRAVAALRHAEVTALAGHRPPVLHEILEIAAGRIGLDVELKEEGCVEFALDAIRRRHAASEVIVTSFLPAAIRCARGAWPDVRAGLLLDDPQVVVAQDALEQARACGATALALAHAIVQRLGLEPFAASELPVFVWTVDDPGALQELLADVRVSGVITDVPAEAVAIRALQERAA